MASDLSQRTDLVIRTRTGAAIVFERRVEQAGPLPIIVLGSLLSARAWIEAHYTGVQWDSERSGAAPRWSAGWPRPSTRTPAASRRGAGASPTSPRTSASTCLRSSWTSTDRWFS